MSEYKPRTEPPTQDAAYSSDGFWVAYLGEREGPFWVQQVEVSGFGYLAFFRVSPAFVVDPAPFSLRRPSVTDLHLLDSGAAARAHERALKHGIEWAVWRSSQEFA